MKAVHALGGLLAIVGCGGDGGGTTSFGDSASASETDATSGSATGGQESSTSTGSSGVGSESEGSSSGTSGSSTGTEGSESTGGGAAPSAEDDRVIVPQNELPADLSVLDNDTGQGLSIDSVDETSARGAPLVIGDDGSIRYVAPSSLWGEDRFEYVVRDGRGRTASASVRVLVRPTLIALADVAMDHGGFAVAAENVGDFAGSSAVGGDDLDGDGAPDLVVGAFAADPNGAVSGRTFVMQGQPGEAGDTLAQAAFVIDGEAIADLSGEDVALAGDVNGDGVGDVIVGARGSDVGGADAGRAYVVFGGADVSDVQLSDIAAGIGGFVINAEGPGDLCGLAVAGAGDVNGDTFDDVIVGAPDAGDDDETGRAYVVYGKANGSAVDLVDVVAGTGGFGILGEDDGDRAGFSVDRAGDVDGDGFDDVVVGALRADPAGSSSGRAYVVWGGDFSASIALTSVTGGEGGFAIDGPSSSARAGFSVAGGEDVDGDGRPDIVVGALGADAAYVVFGKLDGNVVSLADLDGDGFVLQGGGDGEAGTSVGLAGDFNGDGRADIVVGAPSASLDTGRAYVVYGTDDTEAVDLDALVVDDGTLGFAIDGATASDRAGGSVAGAGDVDGDGLADVILGATGTDAGGTAYVLRGLRIDWED